MEDRSPSRPADIAHSPPAPQPAASPAALRFAKWLRRFGYVVFAFYLAWITLGPGDQDARLPPDPGRMISSGLLAISIAAIFFGILIVWGERQRLPPAVRRQARPPLKQTGVPRRFGVGVMLVIMTMYAMLFAALKNTDAVFFVLAAVFVTIIGLSQAILFKGHDPRKASVITGMALGILFPVLASVVVLISGIIDGKAATALIAALFPLLFGVLVGGGLGAIAGYLAGLLIAGVFLLFNKVQRPLEDPDDEEPDAKKVAPDPPASDAPSVP